MLRTHRQDEWDKYMNSLNQNEKSIYKLNRNLLRKKPATHPILGPSGLVYSAQEKTEIFADSLERQFTTIHGPNLPEVQASISTLQKSVTNSSPIFTTPGTIQKLIDTLVKNKAPGWDQITNTALKFLPKNKILQLTKIINSCFKLCYFPNIWKLSHIISIPKPGKNLQLPESYRPIALLSSLSKIYERLILQFLQESLAGKIRDEQFAFRQNHSTVLQLTKLVDQISDNLNQGIQTAAIFLDVEKAFDTVWHDGLLHKMMSMDIPLQLIKITESFLSDRTFSVKIEDQNSAVRKANAGVPQGSCLSPTLFNIYTNDLPTNTNSRVSLFADDTMFYCSNHNARFAILQLQKQIDLASEWFKKWRLRINESKTIAILFGRTKTINLNNIQINNILIPWSRSVKYLGVTIDQKLSFSNHVATIVKKATQIRGILYSILNKKSPIPARTRLNLFKLYILPVLTYAGASWAPFVCKSSWTKIEAVQTIGIRTILGQSSIVRNSVLLNTAGFDTVRNTIKKNSAAMFYRCSRSQYNHIRNIGLITPSPPHPRYSQRPRAKLWANNQ